MRQKTKLHLLALYWHLLNADSRGAVYAAQAVHAVHVEDADLHGEECRGSLVE